MVEIEFNEGKSVAKVSHLAYYWDDEIDELKDILRLRGLRESGGKSELVARVCVAKKQQTTEGGSRFFPVILVPSLFYVSFSIR